MQEIAIFYNAIMLERTDQGWIAHCDDCGRRFHLELTDFVDASDRLQAAGAVIEKYGRGTWLLTCPDCLAPDAPADTAPFERPSPTGKGTTSATRCQLDAPF